MDLAVPVSGIYVSNSITEGRLSCQLLPACSLLTGTCRDTGSASPAAQNTDALPVPCSSPLRKTDVPGSNPHAGSSSSLDDPGGLFQRLNAGCSFWPAYRIADPVLLYIISCGLSNPLLYETHLHCCIPIPGWLTTAGYKTCMLTSLSILQMLHGSQLEGCLSLRTRQIMHVSPAC